MLKISQEQISERWDILPISLREALYSPEYGETIWQIGAKHYLDEKKIGIIAGLAGYIVYGFLHPDDLAEEIRAELNLNPEIANSIAQEIDRKIFSPIKSDLEKVYSPVTEIPEIKPIIKPKLAPESTLPVQPPAELPAVKPTPPSPKATAGEAEPAPIKITELPKVIEATPKAKPPVVSEVEPFIIHEETSPRPVAEKKSVSFPTVDWFKKEKPKKMEPPVKVELEIFGTEKKPFDIAQGKEPPIAKTEPPKQKVIHYREAPTATPFGKAQDESFGTPPASPTPPTPPAPTSPPPPKPFDAAPASVETASSAEVASATKAETAGKQGKPEEPKVINLESFE